MRIGVKTRLLRFFANALLLVLLCAQARADGACTFGLEFPDEKLYQLHSDGSIFVKNDKSCNEPACFGGWFLLDNNMNTVAIASYCELYQMHNDGAIFHYTGKGTAQDQCTGGSCGMNWEQLDLNPQTKAIAVGAPYFSLNLPPFLYQMHSDGSIFRRNNNPCKEAQCFGGWDTLDLNPSTVAIAAGFNGLYQIHNDGKVFRWDGRTPVWPLLDQDPTTVAIAAGSGFYQMRRGGAILRYTGGNESCTTLPCPGWEPMGQDPTTKAIKAGINGLYRLLQDGTVQQKNGAPCADSACTGGWDNLGRHANALSITAGHLLYQMRSDGIFRYNRKFCEPGLSCDAAWDQLDANPASTGIVVNGSLFSR